MGGFGDFLIQNLGDFWTYTGFANATTGHIIMILVGLVFIYLAVAKEFEPMLLIPIGFGILIGNILSFAKGLGVFFETPVRCRILQLESEKSFGYKNVELLSFSAKFRTNVSLPAYIGLGKSVSINNGVVTPIK